MSIGLKTPEGQDYYNILGADTLKVSLTIIPVEVKEEGGYAAIIGIVAIIVLILGGIAFYKWRQSKEEPMQ